MGNKLNWALIEGCNLWPILGVTECNDCPDVIKCWGTDSQLPEPELTPEQQEHWENTLRQILGVSSS